ncbi:hypothetical protein BH11PSE12_BH11PSE12_21690 [soil metagenome]
MQPLVHLAKHLLLTTSVTLTLGIVAFAPAVWAQTSALPLPASLSLYQTLGSDSGISRVVDDLLLLSVNDARISASFKETNMKRLALLLKEQICQISDGPCTYSGDEMGLVHEKMGITSTQFNALAENLQIAMEKNSIPASAQWKLIARLAPMKRQMVFKGGSEK